MSRKRPDVTHEPASFADAQVRIEFLQNDRKRLREEREALYVALGDVRSRNVRLRDALEVYGWHRGECPQRLVAPGQSSERCDCGFDEAIR